MAVDVLSINTSAILEMYRSLPAASQIEEDTSASQSDTAKNTTANAPYQVHLSERQIERAKSEFKLEQNQEEAAFYRKQSLEKTEFERKQRMAEAAFKQAVNRREQLSHISAVA